MKVLLIRPVSDTYIISPPLGLGYIATALRNIGVEPHILDCAKEQFSFDRFEAFIETFSADIVGLQVWSCDVYHVKQSLRIIKKTHPGHNIALKGIQDDLEGVIIRRGKVEFNNSWKNIIRDIREKTLDETARILFSGKK